MPNVQKFDNQGKESGQYDLGDEVFAGRIKVQAVHELHLLQLANRRRALPKTKNRSLVRGGGKKPFKQKGTGRARMGSLRTPLRRGGAAAMGPRGEHNWTQEMPRKARRAAVRSLLTDKVRKGLLSVISDVSMEKPQTKTVVGMLDTMKLGSHKVLFVIPQRDYNFECSCRNLPNVKALLYSNLNPHDLINHEKIVLFEGSVAKMTEVLK